MLIIRNDISPKKNLYYLGALIIKFLQSKKSANFEEVLNFLQDKIDNLLINSIYYALDWLYLMNIIELDRGVLKLCD